MHVAFSKQGITMMLNENRADWDYIILKFEILHFPVHYFFPPSGLIEKKVKKVVRKR